MELTRVSQLCRYCPPQVGVEAVGWVPRETPRFLIIIIFMIIIIGDSKHHNSNKDNIGIGLQRDSYFLTIPLPPPHEQKNPLDSILVFGFLTGKKRSK